MLPFRRPRPVRSTSLLLACLLVASLARFVVPVADPDFWFHVRTGQWILAHRALPTHDLFTWTVPDHRWIDYEYLTEALMAIVFSHWGLLGVSIAFGALTWIGFLFLYRATLEGDPPYLIAAAALALALLGTVAVWGPRPQMVTFAFSAVELFWLRRFLASGDRHVYWTPLLVVLWANLHGGWPIALAFIAVAIAAEGLRRLADGVGPRRRASLVRLGAVLIGCALAPLLSPHGLNVYVAPLGPLTSSAQQALINEWQSPDFHLWYFWPLLLTIVLLGVGLTLSRPRLFDLLLTMLTLAMTLVSARQLALFALAVTPTLVTVWSAAYRDARDRLPRFLVRRRQGRLRGAIATLLIASVATGAITIARLSQQDAIVSRGSPIGAANWLAAHPDVGTRMYNDYSWGGYLAYRFYPDPRRRVYVFGEASVMGDAMLGRWARIAYLRPGWRETLDADRVDYVVDATGAPLSTVLAADPRWKLVYRDQTAVIYVRR